MRRSLRQADRAFSWSDPADEIVRRIRAADAAARRALVMKQQVDRTPEHLLAASRSGEPTYVSDLHRTVC